ncbi:Aste57867_23817 [Aphanomyces stellatus]|uniref:Aste57867_23817 protein n=1 Tax=Aphanomyces stellatus TaxID=120398 RepID=A0A485LNR7_9STRA|nr:hypothetical protein As57867_023744 [Aphanomyces stellatus]VFU00461.1 Aste57867_23817 [Aphanomyces stellatus]
MQRSSVATAAVALLLSMGTSGHRAGGFGTLVDCPVGTPCLWEGTSANTLVTGPRMLHEFLAAYHGGSAVGYDEAKTNVEGHITYIEAVYTHAKARDHTMSMQMGLTRRHLHEPAHMYDHMPEETVSINMHATTTTRRRELRGADAFPADDPYDPVSLVSLSSSSTTPKSSAKTLPATLNWCSTDNPHARSVCADVKSQQVCGSCWAFAATDLIETAVSIATKTDAVSLSSQQLISCSTTAQATKYSYCFARSGAIPTWLEPEMTWNATNTGCNGGMTHIALADAVTKIQNLASRLDWPYVDQAVGNSSNTIPVEDTSSSSSGRSGTRTTTAVPKTTPSKTCSIRRPAEKAAAHISGWQPALNQSSCADTKDTVVLLKRALQQGPLAVAINAKNGFRQYRGGVFTCGSITKAVMIDHALLLVGYATSPTDGEYWILKNSYGVDWGMHGYMWLKTDAELNCGLNVFPIHVTGATAGPAANMTVDGGGALTFATASMSTWIVVAAASGATTLAVLSLGLCVARKRLLQMHM